MNTSTSGHASATLGNVTSNPPGPPHTYFGVAQSMLPAALLLAAAPAKSSLALSLISAHVLECALKAFLSRDGSDTSVRKPRVRHNLVTLWEMAAKQGLNVSMLPPPWVSRLSQVHDSPYYLRYSTGVNGIVLPNAKTMAAELQKVVNAVAVGLI